MTVNPSVQLLLNDEQLDHSKILAELLRETEHLECMVAFAKTSGLQLILKELKEGLRKGLSARFAIGLDFCLTEPALLRKIFHLSGQHRFLKLYISDSSATFHPKIYAFSSNSGCTVMIGSANLTGGGLQHNYESSARIDDPSGDLMQSISAQIDDLIKKKDLLPATKALIDDYERRYSIHQAQQKLVQRRIERANTQNGINTETLHDILLEMKRDDSEYGFKSHRIVRRRNRKAAVLKIRQLAAMEDPDEDFLSHYEQLIGKFHSGGLHRGKKRIAENANQFHEALAAIIGAREPSPGDAYQILLDYFQHIPQAGVNVLTEILHAIDSKRFAVMNQNAVAGLRLSNIHDFPANPAKRSVNAELYAYYCEQADVVRNELDLADFTELDALFNYAYWGHREEAAEDEYPGFDRRNVE